MYLHQNTSSASRNKSTSSTNPLNGHNQISSELTLNDKNGYPALYVFNFENNAGCVFVSGDYSLRPILAYIDKGAFDTTHMPEGLHDWLNKTKENTEIVRAGQYNNLINGVLAWRQYFKEYDVDTTVLAGNPPPPPGPGSCDNPPPPSSVVVGPLLPVTWGQECTYNDLCDITHLWGCGNCNGRPPTGCVATSMAQVIRYHQFPSNYNYASMPTTSGNNEVQRLMSDAGISVDMHYGCDVSGAYTYDVNDAFKNNFHYGSNYWIYQNGSYNQGYGRVRDNVAIYNLPVILSGVDASSAAHQWVCDGTLETTYSYGDCGNGPSAATYLYFHMNWGWHEDWMNGTNATDYNGWFAYDDWNIAGLNWNFQYSKQVVSEIHP